MITLFGGRESPTAGFAIGFDRTILALESEKFDFPCVEIDVYVVPVNDDMIDRSLEITQKLRNKDISADVDLLRRGIGKSLKYASSINAKKTIIIGPRELEQDSVTLRDMNTGKQEIVKINDIINRIK